MKLSVVIVNYNVKIFLDQCLASVFSALKSIKAEVFVVDNNSVDGSCAMVKEKYPSVLLIENKNNSGFSVANNQAIKLAKGEYILLLNPDTVVEEDTFSKCISFADRHNEMGALTVKMIDGKGKFLPESKRALPTPKVSFYKIFGLAKIFPRSKKFARYYLGHLDNDKTNEIEILPGAFMFMRKEALKKTGLLDETFFMYGEDIDLSYRIIKAGYKNYYFPETTIIHYKGESTKKGSINYVIVFYKAMIIFAKKHFSKSYIRYFSLLINLAIYFRASLSIFKRFIESLILPILDIGLIFLFYVLIKPVWEIIKFNGKGSYPDEFLHFAVPTYILIWFFSLLLNGSYRKKIKPWNPLKGVIIGTALILIFYALLPENLRFSRILILTGSVATIGITYLTRFIIHITPFVSTSFHKTKSANTLIVGEKDEIKNVTSSLDKSLHNFKIIGFVDSKENSSNDYYLGHINQLEDMIQIHKINELIFCAKNLSSQAIIKQMLILSHYDINFKIAQPDSVSIIGSNSANTPGDLYTIEINAISKDINKRKKRFFDIIASVGLFIRSPLTCYFTGSVKKFYNNIFNVLSGQKTWIGYYSSNSDSLQLLPPIKAGILTPTKEENLSEEFKLKSNMQYAKDYQISNDILYLLRNFKQLGN